MAGLLTHLGFGLIGALIIYFAFYRADHKRKIVYGSLFILGNILPDLIDFGILSIKLGSLSPKEIMKSPLFDTLAVFGHTFTNWIIIGAILFAIALLFYGIKRISRKTLLTIGISIVLVIVGVFIHLNLDILITETSYWI